MSDPSIHLPIEQPEIFWAWLAGFVDGDGSIGVYKIKNTNGKYYNSARLTVSQKERDVLDYIKESVGLGSVTKRGTTPYGTVMYQWTTSSFSARIICKKLKPHLVIKREKAMEVLRWKPRPQGYRKIHEMLGV